jgi:DedD protein
MNVDQELKQRLIGAAVITALAAIFVPMLFDDPIDETGKTINELKIPELPVKAQDVEIMPLPETVEDVAAKAPEERPAPPAAVSEGDDEAELEAPKPVARITAKNTEPLPLLVTRRIEPVAEEDELPARSEPTAKPQKAAAVKASQLPVPPKPAIEAETAVTRLYLNVGSFSQHANALALQDSLKKQGFAASIKEVAIEKGKVYKVRVGPMLDKAQAQATKAKLSKINVNSFVTGDD